MDRRSEMDELRARRAMEDAERKYRQQQLAKAEKKKRDMEILDMAQKQQEREKYEQQQLEMQQKREEYENALRHSHAMAERERAEAEYVRRRNEELIQNLQEQIENNETKRMNLVKQKYADGAEIKQQLYEERIKLEAARDAMVADMKKKKIPEQYFSEVKHLNIDKFLRWLLHVS